MTRLMFFLAALNGRRTLTRLALFYVVGMLFLLFCLIGGLPHVPSSPAHAVVRPYAAMPKPKPVPANAAEGMRKRLNNRQYARN